MNKEDIEKQKEEIERLSQEVFGKPSKDIKYLLVTNYVHKILLDEELARTGLYQWLNVFNGEVKYPREVKDYNDYDIVQVNLSTQDVPLIGTIREQLKKNGKTKLVVNNDYTTEMWGNSFISPYTLARELDYADMLFGTEYYQTTSLSELAHRKTYVIPHPCDVRKLKQMLKIPQKNIISTIWRRYDNFSYVPYLAVRNHGLTTQLIGYDKSIDRKTWLTTTLFDYVFAGTNCFDFWEQLRESKIVYDPFTFHSYNRTIVECAAFGIPVVGSNRTQSVNICYPYTSVDPYDTLKARRLIEKLLTDEAFYKKVTEYAQKMSEYYNHLISKQRYLKALLEAQNDKRETREQKKASTIEHSEGKDILIQLSEDKNETRKGESKV